MTSGFAKSVAALVSQTQDAEVESVSSDATEDLEDLISPDDDEYVPPKKKMGKYRTYRSFDWFTWSFEDREYFYTDEEKEKALWALAQKEFGGNPANGVFFVKGTLRPPTKLKQVQTYRCPFASSCGCRAEFQEVFWHEENRWSIQIATNAKHDHDFKKKPRGMLKQAMIAAIDSPSKLKNTPKALVGKATTKLGVKLTQEQQRSFKRAVGRQRVSFTTKDLKNGGNGSAYGDVADQLVNKYHRDSIGASFNRDSVFLVGNGVCLDSIIDEEGSETMRFYCVLSTENLLMNGPRQVATGNQLLLAVDGSYRYVVERDHGLFVVKTINHCQTAKTIAYAICNREDKDALVWIFSAIKDEIEAIVNDRIENGIEYI